ncbi:hypothetical protein ACOMHN_047829 [Nucella lapillus]
MLLLNAVDADNTTLQQPLIRQCLEAVICSDHDYVVPLIVDPAVDADGYAVPPTSPLSLFSCHRTHTTATAATFGYGIRSFWKGPRDPSSP